MNTLLKRAKTFRLAFLFIIFPFVSSCLVSCANFTGPGYYAQLVAGETRVLTNRVPIRDMLDDKQVPEKLKKDLRSVLEIREFAIRELGLPATKSFTTYMDTGREFANWSLTATPEFSVRPKTWCFPFAGCASHLTFFDERLAKEYEKKLSREGYDVSVRGVTAYSTGGNFADPAMNTLFEYPDYEYASTVFHEMAHEKLRIPGEPAFNESFAVFVGRIGQYLWVEKHYEKDQKVLLAKRILERTQRSVEFANLVAATWRELDTLYMKNLSPKETRLLKRNVFQKMREDYAVLKESWGGYGGYDGWFKKSLNNARVSETNDYGNLVPLFEKLFEFSNRDFQGFYRQTERLAKLSPRQRKREIQRILKNDAA